MNTETMISSNANDIHGGVMLVHLSIAGWAARKIDKKAAQEVANAHGVASTKGAYYKSLVEGSSLETIKTVATQARTAHYRRTLPWSDAGPRILSNLGYLDYMQEIGQLKQEYEGAVAKFLQDYPLLRQEAKRLLGTLFNPDDYPDLQQVADKFSFKVSVLPLPKGEDFRCDIGAEEAARVRAEIEANTTSAIQQSLADAYDRVAVVVEAFIDRLADPKTIFRDSLVENARSLAEVLPSLNITGDQRLAALAESLKSKLCAADPDVLRQNHTTRRQAYDAAVQMRGDLVAFFGGQLQ